MNASQPYRPKRKWTCTSGLSIWKHMLHLCFISDLSMLGRLLRPPILFGWLLMCVEHVCLLPHTFWSLSLSVLHIHMLLADSVDVGHPASLIHFSNSHGGMVPHQLYETVARQFFTSSRMASFSSWVIEPETANFCIWLSIQVSLTGSLWLSPNCSSISATHINCFSSHLSRNSYSCRCTTVTSQP